MPPSVLTLLLLEFGFGVGIWMSASDAAQVLTLLLLEFGFGDVIAEDLIDFCFKS